MIKPYYEKDFYPMAKALDDFDKMVRESGESVKILSAIFLDE